MVEKKDKKWIQKAVNPKHKGYCTPMSKPTCTPKRKALARTFKAMAKNKQNMLNSTITIKIKQRINKLDSQDYDNITCWQIVESFNKAQVEWSRRQLHGILPSI